jgi:hypothetical protein
MAFDKVVNGIEITEENRFSNFVREKDKGALEDLRKWVEHFKKAGIEAVLGFTKQGYAVYRLGLESVDDSGDQTPSGPKRNTIL